MVEVAVPPSAERLGPKLPLKQHQAPDVPAELDHKLSQEHGYCAVEP